MLKMKLPRKSYHHTKDYQALNSPGIGKWHGIVVSMMACGPEDPGSIPRLAKVHNDVIFFLGVFMIQFNLI